MSNRRKPRPSKHPRPEALAYRARLTALRGLVSKINLTRTKPHDHAA